MAKKCAICTILLDVPCPHPLCPGHHNESLGTICAYCASNARAEVPFSAHLAPSILSTLEGFEPSVAERSFSLLDHVQMFVKPMPQLLLCRRWELQDKTRKTQSLEDFKIAPSIRNDMRASAA
jgi:hypothetical protein